MMDGYKKMFARQLWILLDKSFIEEASEQNTCYSWRIGWLLEARKIRWSSSVSDELQLC